MKMTSQILAAVALAVLSGNALAQLPNLPVDTSNTCVGAVDAARQGRHTATETADGIFWPPNHKLRAVAISAENDDGDPCDVTITGVAQDEATTGFGSGNFTPDAANCSNAGDTSTVDLRGERAGTGTGRYYTITYTMEDPDYPVEEKTGTATLLVPHDQGVAHLGTYLNEGPLFQSADGPISCTE
jgi:hypothetical protein